MISLRVKNSAGSSSLAGSEHIEILRRGPKAWNAWREENPSLVPNLDDAAPTLGERQLGPINGGPINLRSARMQRAFLRFATLSAANLEAADMSAADLAYARLDRANLKTANLSHAVLDYADFNGADLAEANFSGASLRHVQNLTQAQIKHSICDAATILPEHLEHPASYLEIVRETKAEAPLSHETAPGNRAATKLQLASQRPEQHRDNPSTASTQSASDVDS